MSYEPRKCRRIIKWPIVKDPRYGPASAYNLTARYPKKVKPGPGSAYEPTGLQALYEKLRKQ